MTIVVCWTVCWDVVALTSGGTKSGVRIESQAIAATIICCAAAGNSDASLLNLAPRLSDWAGALKTAAVVVDGVGTAGRNVVTGVGRAAPGSARSEGQASAAVVIGQTA